MKRYNKFSRTKPTVHNSKKPFNPGKYGKVWGSIDFELAHGSKAHNPVPPSTQPIMGTLIIGGKRVEITFSEANRIIETLQDSQYRYNVAKKMGMLEAGHEPYRG
tara:strand:- start:316 stop:630 length:315 start_codon:yes stop_codon:yes gene_type:complete